ncbi:MAG: TIGR03936 family radical SAM-associated protein [Actinomycetes bacterium]
MRGDTGFPVRMRYAKRGPVRFIGHRDVARAFERAFRIAELPLAFSAGFSPHPKVSFGPALAVGYESDAEYLDVELAEALADERLVRDVTGGLPAGMTVTGVTRLADRAPSLQEEIASLGYRVTTGGVDPVALSAAVEAFLALSEIRVPVARKGEHHVEDIRPSVLALTALPGESVVDVEVATRPRTLRVADVVTGLRTVSEDAAPLEELRVVRTRQWIERGGARWEPLDVDRRSEAPEGATRALETCA